MKKQWLSIVLVLCMVLCMAPATALAAEGETGTLKITVDISGVYEGDNVGDKTFSFEILRKYANYGHYRPIQRPDVFYVLFPLSRAKQRAQWMCQSRRENMS